MNYRFSPPRFSVKIASSLLLMSNLAFSAEYTIDQKGQKFSQTSIAIQQGDKIKFTNSDPMFHNIYSLSAEDAFDLGSYPKGGIKDHQFNVPGVHLIECAIHPFMKLQVTVK